LEEDILADTDRNEKAGHCVKVGDPGVFRIRVQGLGLGLKVRF